MGVAAIFMVAADGIPVHHKLRVVVDKLIVGHVYADCNNLLNQPLRYYQGSKDYTMQQEYYGVKLNGGVKVTF